jgi:hypothetical protein
MKPLRLIFAGSLLLAAAGGLYLYQQSDAGAAQGDGALAQAPMNSSSTAPPAFIMAIDDSNSMTFQTLFPGSEGGAFWNSAGSSFFISNPSLRLRTQTDAFNVGNYVYVIPSATTTVGAGIRYRRWIFSASRDPSNTTRRISIRISPIHCGESPAEPMARSSITPMPPRMRCRSIPTT